MPVEVVDPPAHMLAGKRAEGPVMRNGEVRNAPRGTEGSDWDGVSQTEAARLQQRLDALESANLIRFDRARTKERLGRGEIDFDSLLDDMPASCAKVAVLQALTWLPWIGPSKARKIILRLRLMDTRLSNETPLGRLTQKQKYLLSAQVRPTVERYRERVGTGA